MKKLTCALIGVAALVFILGAVSAFAKIVILVPPHTYWRGAVGLLLFAIAIMMRHKNFE